MEYRITVLIGIYNCASTLVEALDSLMNQTYKGFKVVLCDDGSKDETLKVAGDYARNHDNIIVIKNDNNMGLNFTLNHCLEYADTEYVARMDGDDISLPTRFEKEIDFLDRHPEFALVSTPMIYFDEDGDYRVGIANREPKRVDFIHGPQFCHAPCMIRTAAIKDVKGYTVDKRLLRVEDDHLWFKLYEKGYKGYNLEEALYKMRDDRKALKRRTWQSRKNEVYVKHIGFKMIGLPWYYQIYALRPILAYLAPSWLYNIYHRKSFK